MRPYARTRIPGARRVATAALALPLAIAGAPGCRSDDTPLSPAEVRAVYGAELPLDPDAPAWAAVPLHAAALIPQDLVEPRQMAVTTTRVSVQAMSDGRRLAFRLRWDDATRDDTPGPARFTDACAVQLPAAAAADAPAPQMGEEARPVEITYWSAVAQAAADGRPDELVALYPRAKVDPYPFEAAALAEDSPARAEMAKRYAPARAAGNPVAGPRRRAVEDLVAAGPGTLAPAPVSRSDGRGGRSAAGWTVVVSRPLPNGIAPGGRGRVAFAVWDGARGEVGARKMRTGWIPLSLEAVGPTARGAQP